MKNAHYHPSNLNGFEIAILLSRRQWVTWAENWKSPLFNVTQMTGYLLPRYSTELTGGQGHRQVWLSVHSFTKFWKISLTVRVFPLSTLYIAPNLKSNYHEFKSYLKQSFHFYLVLTVGYCGDLHVYFSFKHKANPQMENSG